MKNFKKLIITVITGAIVLSAIGCEYETNGSAADIKSTKKIANSLQANQPTPTDINYSLERYNLIRRAYWVNGQREKANSLVCEIEKPLGYIVLFTDNGGIVGKFVVDGKVSSLNSYLTPDSLYYEVVGTSIDNNSSHENDWLADVDGSYGSNDNGIFFFDTRGNYVEWTGTYLYTDIPMKIDNPVINFDVNYEDNAEDETKENAEKESGAATNEEN